MWAFGLVASGWIYKFYRCSSRIIVECVVYSTECWTYWLSGGNTEGKYVLPMRPGGEEWGMFERRGPLGLLIFLVA